MVLSFEPIKRLMKTRSNGRQISDKAVIQMSIYVEEYVKNVAMKGFEILDEMNTSRGIQGIRLKKRLDDDCIRRGARIINYKCLNRYDNHQMDEKSDDGKQLISNNLGSQFENGVEVV